MNPVEGYRSKNTEPNYGGNVLQGVFMNVSPATKAAAISDYLAGKGGYFKIASEYGISPITLKKWVESPPS